MSDIQLPEYKRRHYDDEEDVEVERMLWRRIVDLESYVERLRQEIEMILKDHDAAISEEDDGK